MAHMPPVVNGTTNGSSGGGGPPPPPPPMPNGPLSGGGGESLAAQLANAQLRKANRPQPDAISTTSTSSSSSSGSASSGIYGTLRGNRTSGTPAEAPPAGGSGTSLMDEMAKTLARRRAMVKENSAPNVPALQNNNSNSHSGHVSIFNPECIF